NARRAHAFTDDDVATLSRLAAFVSAAVGSARELSRVAAELLEFRGPTGTDGLVGPHAGPADAAGRYVMDVLSPGAASRIESGRRIRQVLDDPSILTMVFQPIVDLVANEVAAVEALARFGVTPYRAPDLWFRDAHDDGLGVELEMLAARRALAQLAVLPDGIALTINVGPHAVLSPSFAALLLDVPSRRVILELTEHTAVDDYPALVATLRALRRTGTRMAIDDTGSGYSSLAHILKLAPDFIKLDRELTSGIDLDPVRRALATSLVAFAGETGAQIIAEGVETEGEVEALRRIGVRYGQGFHLS